MTTKTTSNNNRARYEGEEKNERLARTKLNISLFHPCFSRTEPGSQKPPPLGEHTLLCYQGRRCAVAQLLCRGQTTSSSSSSTAHCSSSIGDPSSTLAILRCRQLCSIHRETRLVYPPPTYISIRRNSPLIFRLVSPPTLFLYYHLTHDQHVHT